MAYAIGDVITFDGNLVENKEFQGEVFGIDKSGHEHIYLVSVDALGKVVYVDGNGNPV